MPSLRHENLFDVILHANKNSAVIPVGSRTACSVFLSSGCSWSAGKGG